MNNLMSLCIKCNLQPPIKSIKSIKSIKAIELQKYCSVCIVAAISQLPNPDCEYCMGEGAYYGHSHDCDNDGCVLAGGFYDCRGQMIKCDCSILDRDFEILFGEC